MPRLTVYRGKSGRMLLDCQADALHHLGTRVVIPLLPPATTPPGLARLTPTLEIDGEPWVLATHLLTAIPVAELGREVGTITDREYDILNALDMLLTGV